MLDPLTYRIDDEVATNFLEEVRRKAAKHQRRNRRRNNNVLNAVRDFILQLIVCRNF